MTDTESSAASIIVLDFETTGLSPDQGERAIEIGAVKLIDGEVVDTFQQLMYPGKRINHFIEDFTGITNNMLKDAPACGEVMREFSDFIEGFNLVAHNASFDSRFLDAELRRIRLNKPCEFACSMLIARRIYPGAPNHKLGTLVSYKRLAIIDDIKTQYGFDRVPFKVMQRLSRTAKSAVANYLQTEANRE